MRDYFKPALVLFSVAVVVTLALAWTNAMTEPVIAARTAADLEASKRAVLPQAASFTDVVLPPQLQSQSEGLSTVREAFEGRDASGAPVGLVVSCASQGYGGLVHLTIGIDDRGRVAGLKVISHTETPGLGDKVLLPTSKVMRQLLGMAVTQPLHVVKGTAGPNEVDAVSGSTITSRAVTRATSGAWELWKVLSKQGVQP